MIRFQLGEEVQVEGLPASDWCGLRGIVVKISEGSSGEESEPVQECAVQFSNGRRWFLATHLVRTAPQKRLRFFRTKVLDQWNELSTADVGLLNGSRDELINLLQEKCCFARRRAELEVDEFISVFEKRIQATDH